MDISQFKQLNFSYNWNNKLNCKAYTSIRLYGSKYQVGTRYAVHLGWQFQHVAEVVAVKPFYLHQVNNFMAFLDTGYSEIECRDIIIRMYPKVNFQQQQVCMVLLRVVPEKELEQTPAQ